MFPLTESEQKLGILQLSLCVLLDPLALLCASLIWLTQWHRRRLMQMLTPQLSPLESIRISLRLAVELAQETPYLICAGLSGLWVWRWSIIFTQLSLVCMYI